MEKIYQETIAKVEAGARCRVNLERMDLRINGKYVIKHGKYEGNLGIEPTTSEESLQEIERLYERYRHSIPSERSDAQRKVYFQALAEYELSDDDMFYGERRDVAQIALELYVLCAILNNSLVWDEFAPGKWFWKSQNQSGLILLKKWFNNK